MRKREVEHGSAAWNDFTGYPKTEILENGYRLIFGGPDTDDAPNSGNYHTFAPVRHFLSVAPTRSGKGVSLIIPNLLHYKGPCLVIDPKGENAWITAEYRRNELKQKTIILDPWGEVNRRYGDYAGERETVARFNPLSILNPNNPHYADDVAYIADALIINQGKDPHWDDSARELVSGLIAYVVESRAQNADTPVPTLPLVRALLSKPVEALKDIAADAQKFGNESVACRKLGRFTLYSKEIGSIVSTALTQTAFLDSETLSKNLSASDFSFDELAKGQATIYLVLPVDKLRTYGRWLRLMVSIGIRTVARDTDPFGWPVLFVLDEFGTIGSLSAVEQAFGLMAGLKMCLWAFVQDLNQLKRDYPDGWETFMGNSEAISFFNVMDQFSCEHFSKMLGVQTLEVISKSTAEMRKGGFFKASDPNYRSMDDRTYSRDLLQPSEIRRIRHELGIIVGRFDSLFFEKINYYEDDDFLIRSRPDPHFPETKKRRDFLLQKDLPEKVEITNFKTAVLFLEKIGHAFSLSKALFPKPIITSKDGKEYKFKNEDSLIKWAKEAKEKYIKFIESQKAPKIVSAVPETKPHANSYDQTIRTLKSPAPTGREPETASATHARPGPGRNDPCPCGSGIKYKKCCGSEEAKKAARAGEPDD